MTTKDQDSIFINNFFDRSAGCSLLKHEGDVCPCIYKYIYLGGGFRYCLFSSPFGRFQF